MQETKYFETHNHSCFSYLDGVSNPKDMARRAKQLGYKAMALTDHGVIDGWYEFYTACKEQDIQPILSCEFYVAKDREDLEENPWKKGIFRTKRGHLIIHPKGQEGIDAIRELYNESWVNYKEQGKKQIIFEEDLHKYAGKILLQSACLGSYIDTEEKVIRLKKIFGDDLYLEIQPHKLDFEFDTQLKDWIPCEDMQVAHNKKIINWARTHDVNLIVTGDAHYLTRKDKILQDILILNSIIGRNTGWCFKQDTNYLMGPEDWWSHFKLLDMEDVFSRADFDKSLETLQTIAEKTQGLVLEKEPSLRKFDVSSHPLYTEGCSQDLLISRIIKDVGRFVADPVYQERLKYELKVIKEKGFMDYFLIQEDIIRWNRTKGYLVGPARGSAAGCLLAYYMDITKVDPIKYGLLFERFMDLSRNDFPDIDTDYEMKEETVEYISDKYGAEFVMAIGAYQTIKIKTAIKQAYRILYKDRDYSYSLVNRVTGAIPDSNARGEGDQLAIFGSLLRQSKVEFENHRKRKVNYPPQNIWAFMMDKPDLIESVGKLLGKVTNMRVHPCSIVISDQPVKDILPVATVKSGTSKEKWVTAFDGKAVEASGYLKFDILGLKTLNCIGSCIREIRKYKGNVLTEGEVNIDITDPNNIWDLEPTDPKIFEKMALGDTDTVFQFNTEPLKRLLISMVAGDFNDLVATVALIRPGPLKAGFPKLYVDRKFQNLGLDEVYTTKLVKGKERQVKGQVPYGHSSMDEILKDTYNVITYQEQVQKIFVKVGGFTPIESNSIRKAISKGKRQLILDSKPKFSKYAMNTLEPSWTQKQVDVFYEDMIGFGSYCFNLSHSVSYAFLGYVCQYLKTYYPLEWWSGNLQHAGEKGLMGIVDTIRKGELAPLETVNINESKETFYYNGKQIIMPLKHIDGVGDNGLKYIVEGQPFTSLKDFVDRMPGRSVRKNCVVGLIVAGAFKDIEPNKTRPQLLEHYLKDLKKLKEIPPEYQILIDDEAALERKHCNVDPFHQSDWVEKYKSLFDSRLIPISELESYSDGAALFIGGEIINIKYILVKNGKNKGQKMANIMLRQVSDTVKVTMWPNMVAKYQDLLNRGVGSLVEVRGKVGRYNNNVQLTCSALKEIRVG